MNPAKTLAAGPLIVAAARGPRSRKAPSALGNGGGPRRAERRARGPCAGARRRSRTLQVVAGQEPVEHVNATRLLYEEELRHSRRARAMARLAGAAADPVNDLLTLLAARTRQARDRLGASHPLSGDLGQIADALAHAAPVIRRFLAFDYAPEVRPAPSRRVVPVARVAGRGDT